MPFKSKEIYREQKIRKKQDGEGNTRAARNVLDKKVTNDKGKAEKREIDTTNIGNHNQFIFLIMHSLRFTVCSQVNIY